MYKQFILYVILLTIAGCVKEIPEPVKLFGEAQGTYYSIIYYDDDQLNLKKWSADSKQIVVKGAGHAIQWYHPEVVDAEILDILN